MRLTRLAAALLMGFSISMATLCMEVNAAQPVITSTTCNGSCGTTIDNSVTATGDINDATRITVSTAITHSVATTTYSALPISDVKQ